MTKGKMVVDLSRVTIKTWYEFLDPSVRDKLTGTIDPDDVYDSDKHECIVFTKKGKGKEQDITGTVFDTIVEILGTQLKQLLDEDQYTAAHEATFHQNPRAFRLFLGTAPDSDITDRTTLFQQGANSTLKKFLVGLKEDVSTIWITVQHTGFKNLGKPLTQKEAVQMGQSAASGFTATGLGAAAAGTSGASGGTASGFTAAGLGAAAAGASGTPGGAASASPVDAQATPPKSKLFPGVDPATVFMPDGHASPYGFSKIGDNYNADDSPAFRILVPPALSPAPTAYSSYVFVQDFEREYILRGSLNEKRMQKNPKSMPSFTPEDTADAWYDRFTIGCLTNGIFVPPYATLEYGNKMGSKWNDLKKQNPAFESFLPIWSNALMELLDSAVQANRMTHPLPDKTDISTVMRKAAGDGHQALYLLMQYFAPQLNPPTESKVDARFPPKFLGCKSLEEYTARFKQFCRQRFYLSRHIYATPELHEMYLAEIPHDIVVPFKMRNWGPFVERPEYWSMVSIPPPMRFDRIVESITRACLLHGVDVSATITARASPRPKISMLQASAANQDDDDDVEIAHIQALASKAGKPITPCSFCHRLHDHERINCERLVSGMLCILIARENPAFLEEVGRIHGRSLGKIYTPFSQRDKPTVQQLGSSATPNSAPVDSSPAPSQADVVTPNISKCEAVMNSAPYMEEYEDFLLDRPGVIHSVTNQPFDHLTALDAPRFDPEFPVDTSPPSLLPDEELLQHVRALDDDCSPCDLVPTSPRSPSGPNSPSRDGRVAMVASSVVNGSVVPPWTDEKFRDFYAHMDHGATITVVRNYDLLHRAHSLARPRILYDVGGTAHHCLAVGFLQLYCDTRRSSVFIPAYYCRTVATNIISPCHLSIFWGGRTSGTTLDNDHPVGYLSITGVFGASTLEIHGRVFEGLLWVGPLMPATPVRYSPDSVVAEILSAGEACNSSSLRPLEPHMSPARVAAVQTRSRAITVAPAPIPEPVAPAVAAAPAPTPELIAPAVAAADIPMPIVPAPSDAATPSADGGIPRRRMLRTLLHQRLGHLHSRRLSELHKSADGIPPGVPDHDPCSNCPICLSNKLHRSPADTMEEHTVTALYEGLSMDLGFIVQRPDKDKIKPSSNMAPVSVPSDTVPLTATEFAKLPALEKYKYQLGANGEMGYLLIRDHYSGALYGTTLQSKAPPLDFIRSFLEKHRCALPHKFVRLDHGGDLGGSRRLQDLLTSFGYAIQLTAPDSPHQNGLIERINQDVGAYLRTSLNGAGLHPKFWPYAFHMFMRIHNMLPHSRSGLDDSSMKWKSPFEVIMGRRPDLSKFRTFGCRVWVRPPGGRKRKLIDNARKGRFLGYKSTMKNILYLDEVTHEIKEAFHVQFDEAFNDLLEPPPNAVVLRAISNNAHLQFELADDVLSPADLETTLQPSLGPVEVVIPLSAPVDDLGLSFHHDVVRDRAFVSAVAARSPASQAKIPWAKYKGAYVLRINGSPVQHVDDVVSTLQRAARRVGVTDIRLLLDPDPYVFPSQQQEESLHLSSEQLACIHAIRSGPEACDDAYFDFLAFYDKRCEDGFVHSLGATVLGTAEERSLPSFTRARLKRLSTWPDWQSGPKGEFAQLDDMEQKGMYGDPVPRPAGAIVLRQHWTYILKSDGTRKARNCCDGSKRAAPALHGEAKTYASCVEQPCMRVYFALCAADGLIVYGADAANAFANSPPPNVPTYVAIDDAYHDWYLARKGIALDRQLVLPVQHALQGHPESGSLWEQMINRILLGDLGLSNTVHERNLYVGKVEDSRVLICRQVDDLSIATQRESVYHTIVDRIHVHAPMVKLGLTTRFNGVDVEQTRHYIALSCSTYIQQMLDVHDWDHPSEYDSSARPFEPLLPGQLEELQETTGPAEGTPAHLALVDDFGFTYRGVLGELIFVFVVGRLDIGFAVVHLSKYAATPADVHFRALRRVVAYLRANKSWALLFWRAEEVPELPCGKHSLYVDPPPVILPAFPAFEDPHRLYGFVDAAYATDLTSRRSVSGLCCMMAGAAVVFKSKQQDVVACSSTEAEFVAAVQLAKVVKYLRSILHQLNYSQTDPTPIYEDNQAAIAMINSTKPTPRSRHIDIQYYAIQEWKQRGILTMQHIAGTICPPDALTKPLGWVLHNRHCRRMMGHYGPPAYARYSYTPNSNTCG
jgi:Reverse transcriptase (RNA-dependent DNA polymerase)